MQPPGRRCAWRGGFTLIEVVVTLMVLGVVVSVAVGRFGLSEERQVEIAGSDLVRKLDMARTKAIAARTSTLVAFDEMNREFTGYLDDDRDGSFDKDAAEVQAFHEFGEVDLPRGVIYGRGAADPFPGDSLTGAVTLPDAEVVFDTRGVPTPLGTRGVIYLRHSSSDEIVAAVTVMPSGSFRVWRFHDGAWQ